MATRKTHGFHAREREREDKRERGKFDFTSEKDYLGRFESGWNSPSVNMFERKKKERCKKKSFFMKESMALILFI